MKMNIGTEDIKIFNRQLVIRYLQGSQNATKKNISLHTNLSITTVTTLLKELQKENLVCESFKADSTGGRRAVSYILNEDMRIILNIQIERTFFAVQLINIYGEIVNDTRIDITDMEDLENCLIDNIKTVLQSEPVIMIGIGVPGIIHNKSYYADGRLEDIGVIIEEELEIAVHLVNDLNAIAYGYSINDIGKDIVYIHINEECSGAGLILNNAIVNGSKNFAGEVGFMKLGNGLSFDQVVRNSNFEEFLTALSDLIISVNCLVNPKRIILGGNHKFISALSKQTLSELFLGYAYQSMLPEIVLEKEFSHYYKKGLAQIMMSYYLMGRMSQ